MGPQLRWRLLAESRESILEWHLVFIYLQDVNVSLFSSICTDAIFWHAHEPEDDIFTSDTNSIGAYYIAQGEYVFTAKTETLGVLNSLLDEVKDSRSVGRQQ